MKDNNGSLLQHLTASLARKTRHLLRHLGQVPEQPDKPARDPRSMSSFPEDELAMNRRRQSFSSEIFAELLIELPDYQRKISQAYKNGDRDLLRNHVHRLLGAVAYCDAPELETALRTLHRSIRAEAPDSPEIIDASYIRASTAINSTLHYSGYRGNA